MKREHWLIALAAGAGAAAGTYYYLTKDNIPEDAIVRSFDINKFLGKWYEVARLPSWIEKNLNQVSDNYFYNEKGEIALVTNAYHTEKEEWKSATGTMKAAKPNTGKLKVSYLGPFYLDYNVLDIDRSYHHALVCGGSKNYLWILSRDQKISNELRKRFLKKAKDLGFAIENMEWV